MIPRHLRKAPLSLILSSPWARFQLTQSALGASLGFTALAIWKYPGGTQWAPTAPGHDFWHNFLCDLLRNPSISGAPNPQGARFALFGFFALLLALGSLYSLTPSLLALRPRLGRQLSTLGIASCVLLSAVPLTPSNHSASLHALAVLGGGVPALLAFAGLIGALAVDPGISKTLRVHSLLLLVGTCVALAEFAREALLHQPGLAWLPALNRVLWLMLLPWILLVTATGYRRAVLLLAHRAKLRQRG